MKKPLSRVKSYNLDDKLQLAKRLRVRMAELSFTSTDLSEITGLSQEYISKLRYGATWPASTDSLIKLSSALNLSIDFFLFGHDAKK